jgi:hypothetical protein
MIRRNLKHLLALVLFGLTASMWAQSSANTTDVQRDRKDLRNDRRDLNKDRKDIRSDQRDLNQDRADRNKDARDINKDQRDLNQDRRERNQDLKKGDTADAAKEQKDINHDKRDLKSDRRDLRADNGDIRKDKKDLHADRKDARKDKKDIRHDRHDLHRDSKRKWHAHIIGKSKSPATPGLFSSREFFCRLFIPFIALRHMDGQRRFEKSAGGIPGLHNNRVRSCCQRQRSIQRTRVRGEFGDIVHVDSHRCNWMSGLGRSNKMNR